MACGGSGLSGRACAALGVPAPPEDQGQQMKITSPRSAPVRPGHPPAAAAGTAEHPAATAGRLLVRYGLVVVIAWIGALKYGSYEATAIQPPITHSPPLSWLYHIFRVRALAAAFGATGAIPAPP